MVVSVEHLDQRVVPVFTPGGLGALNPFTPITFAFTPGTTGSSNSIFGDLGSSLFGGAGTGSSFGNSMFSNFGNLFGPGSTTGIGNGNLFGAGTGTGFTGGLFSTPQFPFRASTGLGGTGFFNNLNTGTGLFGSLGNSATPVTTTLGGNSFFGTSSNPFGTANTPVTGSFGSGGLGSNGIFNGFGSLFNNSTGTLTGTGANTGFGGGVFGSGSGLFSNNLPQTSSIANPALFSPNSIFAASPTFSSSIFTATPTFASANSPLGFSPNFAGGGLFNSFNNTSNSLFGNGFTTGFNNGLFGNGFSSTLF